MAKRERRTFTDEQKMSLISEINSGRKLIDVAAEHKIQPSQISQWKRKMDGGKSASKKAKANTTSSAQPNVMKLTTPTQSTQRKFSPRSSGNDSRASGSSTIDELERMIGQLSVENARLRRELEGR